MIRTQKKYLVYILLLGVISFVTATSIPQWQWWQSLKSAMGWQITTKEAPISSNHNGETTIKEHTDQATAILSPTTATTLSYKGFSGYFPVGSVARSIGVTVTALEASKLPEVPTNIVNLTKTTAGYRVSPQDLKLKQALVVTINYDKTKLPEGYTEKDIQIFSYNKVQAVWQKLPKDSLMVSTSAVRAKTFYASDFIAGIIKLPESPDTSGYTPTTISGLKAATPLLGIQPIQMPAANAEGTATTGFSIELPKGRAGLQPSLQIQYQDEGGASWAGTGWNLALPSLSVDTRWGAPRYDEQKETESYILSGEDLLPNAHREEWKDRVADQYFYPRREGAFQSIQRLGNSPSAYHWVVKSKSGLISYYGGTENSQLSTPQGAIGYWALREQCDLRGNTIHYEYTKDGGVLYPKSIYYTGKDNSKGVYSVHFITDKDLGEPQRKDIQISARLGFKQEHNRLLRKVEVKYKNQLVRAYELIYQEGAFRKPLLKEIKTYDAEGQLFYANTIDYYDDVRDSAGKYQPFGAFKKWEVPKDNIKYTFVGVNGFSGHPTLAGTSSSTSKGFSYRVGVGPPTGAFKVNTLGGHGGNSWGKTKTQVFLQDIDGDNLPDKVFADDNRVYYHKNISSSGETKFSPDRIELNLPTSGVTKTYSYNNGVDLQLSHFNVGYNRQVSTSTTESYFMDFNGDGLVDFAHNGRVLYNRLINGVPTFLPSSGGTPAPIFSTGNDIELEGDTSNTKEELEKYNPLNDVVRTWKAPYTGAVKIQHTYQLQKDNSEERQKYKKNDGTEKADGVRLYLQKAGQLVWKEDIEAEDYTRKQKQDHISVKQGEVLYFRLSSKYDGNFDKTLWKQNITYTNIGDEKDYNGLDLKHYEPTIDELYSSEIVHFFGTNTAVQLSGIFSKNKTSDKVKLMVNKKNPDYSNTVVFEKQFDEEQVVNLDLSTITLPPFAQGEGIEILVQASTEINWKQIEIQPKVTYTDDKGESKTEPLNVDFSVYEKLDPNYIPVILDTHGDGKVKIFLNKKKLEHSKETGTVEVTVKQQQKVASRRKFKITELNISGEALEHYFDVDTDSPLHVEAVFSSTKLYNAARDEGLFIDLKIGSTVYTRKQYAAYTPYTEQNKNKYFGKAFRGWGSFVVNGNLAGDTMEESRLKDFTGGYADEEGGAPDIDPNRDPEQEEPSMEISKVYFVRTATERPEKTHRGLEPDIYIQESMFSPSRLGENDLEQYLDTTLPELQGGSNRALSMINQSRSHAISAGGGGGGFGIGNSKSWGTSEVKQTMSDFNGDRFPDFVFDGVVQYTEPRGGLENRKTDLGGGFSRSKTGSIGGTVNGAFFHGEPKSSLTYNISKNDQQKKSTIQRSTDDADKAKNSASISGNIAQSEDHGEYVYTDINGDGLADRLSEDGQIQYNTGYGFLPPETWQNFGGLTSGETLDKSAGLGYSTLGSSFTGGLNYGESKTQNHSQLLDFNGDGLADRIVYTKNNTFVYQNLGTTWDTTPLIIPKVADNPIAVSRAISYGGSANFSVYFRLVFIRVGFTAGAFAGKSTNRMEASFMDMDGDGNLDYILSDGEDDLRVALSNIRRTNKLKSVKNATGSTFEVDYEWIAPTYENPYSRWVLKSVKTFDGHHGDGEDYTHTEFSYKDPYYDRRERTFYGFAEVEQKQLNPKDGTVLRTTVQNFYNRDYFRKSLPKNSYTLDQNGNKLTEQNTLYQIKDAKTNTDIDPIALALPNTDATSVFIAPVETTERQYEGSGYLEHKTAQTYDAKGNIITYQDFGNGNANSAIKANISYYESQTPYYGGIAKSLAVYDEQGLVRKREADINPATGEVVQIRNYMEASKYATTDLAYDDYGNLSKVTGAENHKGERATLQYEYDDETHSHITKITDQFGYQNTMAYDYRFNAPIKTTDRNGSTIQYTLDAKGRTTRILAPKEAAAGVPYTIAYEYYPEAKVPYAKTRNYDAEHGADIITYTYMDGVGRTLQVKKTAALFQGKDQADAERLIVSGKQVYDALGRVVESYYPTTETPSEAFSTQVATLAPTTTAYDTKDRPTLQTLPDGSTVQTAYDIAELSGTKTLKTTVTDALGRASQSYTDVLGRTLRQVQPTGIETQYEYNALGEVLKVTDAEGHETLSTYDLLGRRTQLTHPDAGTTTLAYDKAGNLIRRQTAQIREQMPDAAIEYQYSYNRLQEIQYPKHPENNVRYHYGKQSESPLRRGRLWLVEDASGGTEYFYGNMGEVTKEIRSIRITPTEVQTYITEYAYDTWNRIQHMTYPDGEVLDFGYNRAGQLTSLTGKKGKYEYTYLKQQGYDEFEQKVYRLYGNGTETSYTYDATMRRLANLKAQSGTYVFQNNRYTYDLVGNILQVANQVPIINYALGGASLYNYSYDELNRLVIAKGTYTGEANSAEYQFQMQYNKLNGIVQKSLTHKQNGKDKGYVLDYVYGNKSHPHALSELKDSTTPKPRVYEYDGNGNPTTYQGFKDFRLMVWDEENRLQGINDNGKLHLYTYDHTGERAVKSSAESQSVVTNGQTSAVIAHTENYTAYINPYFVVNKGKFTKHYFEGSSRIVSKLGEGTFQQPSGLTAGGIDYIKQSAKMQEAIDAYVRGLNVPPGPPTQQGIYASPEWTGKDYPSISWSDISQDQEPPEGWPRPPKFNEPGDVPGPPVQFGDPVKPDNVKGGFGFKDNGVEEKNLYFYHPDHLGSSSYITDRVGKVTQHTEYIAFGEVLFDEHTTEVNMPYLFNGKELDQETGLYYYGARYYDARVSLWLNVDPLVEKTMQPYAYTNNNPVMFIDPTGMEAEDPPKNGEKYKIGYIWADKDGIWIRRNGGWASYDNKNVSIIDEVVLTKKLERNWYDPSGKGNWALGIASAASSLKGDINSMQMYSDGVRKGTQGNYTLKGRNYNLFKNDPINNATKPISKFSKVGKVLGAGGLAFGVLFDIKATINYYDNPDSKNSLHPAKAGSNLGFGLWGYFGGIPGAAVSTIYFGVDSFYPGGWIGDSEHPGALQDQTRMIEENQKVIPNFNLYNDARGAY